MNKHGPPPAAPPSYAEAVGGVPPSSPFTPPAAPGPTIVTTVVPVGPQTTHMVCPSCHAEIDTSVRSEPSLMAWITGGLLVFFGCWLGCCLIPCCIPECMDNHHTCPNCKAYLGRYRHFWRKLLSRIFSVQLSRSRALFFYVTLKSHHPSQLTQESWYLFNNIMFFKTNIHSRLSCGQMYWTGSTHNWRIIFLHRIILVYDTLIAFLRWYIDKCNRGKIPFTSFEFRVLHFGISLGCWRAICVR